MNTEPTTTTLPALPDWQRDHLAVLLNSLDGVTITDAERASLTWLAGWERHTIEMNRTGIARGRGSGHPGLLGDDLTIHGFPFDWRHVVDR